MNPVETTPKQGIHYTAPYVLNPTNPLSLNLIGAGGTGSQMLTLLARMNHAMTQLGHPGFDLRLWDGDCVSEANLGRQLFAQSELGLNKATALINRTNRFFRTNWKAIPVHYERQTIEKKRESLASANLFVSCVDTLKARTGIAELLTALQKSHVNNRHKPYYWLDFGNSQQTGQVILSTVGPLPQPDSQKFKPVGELPFVTEEFAALLAAADTGEQTPSCSLAEALTKQDLFINSTLANLGCSLLWSLMRTGLTHNRGLFLNLTTFRTVPLSI